MTVYSNSKGELWPILKLYDKNYTCSSFVVALYYGTSKPKSVNEFMRVFVEEAHKLIKEGVMINKKHYQLKIMAIIADAQAIAYLKCIKGPTGFAACERCTVFGVTVNWKRVYPEINCEKRTMESFISRNDKEHQHENCLSPLLEIPVDPIKDTEKSEVLI